MELHAPVEPLPAVPRSGLPGLGLAVSAGLHGSILLALVVIGVASAQTDDPGTGVVVEMQWEGPQGVALAMAAPPQPEIQAAPVPPPVPDVPAAEASAPQVPAEDVAAEPVPADVPPPSEDAMEAVQPSLAPDPQPKPEPKPVEEPVPQAASVPPAPTRPTPPPRPVQQARPLPQALAGQGFSMAAEGASQAATTENTGLTDKLVAPRAIYRPASPPPYPPAAVREGREGDPVVLIDLDSQGQIRGLSIKKSSGYPDLDTAAMNSLRVWIFAPATRNGVPFAAALEMTVRFRLDEVRR